MRVCNKNLKCIYAESSYLMATSQSCYNTGACPHDEVEFNYDGKSINFPSLTKEQAEKIMQDVKHNISSMDEMLASGTFNMLFKDDNIACYRCGDDMEKIGETNKNIVSENNKDESGMVFCKCGWFGASTDAICDRFRGPYHCPGCGQKVTDDATVIMNNNDNRWV